MARPLARLAVTGTVATAIDIGTFALLRPAGVIRADAAALVVATGASYELHRAVTFADDPYDRWLRERWAFLRAAVVGGAVDLAVTWAGARETGGRSSARRALAAKSTAVAVAGAARWVLHRQALFAIVRSQRFARREAAPAEGDLRLSVVVPAYNEADRIATTVTALRSALAPLDGGTEVIVVDDGSADGTAAAARAAGADQVLVLPVNRGKGAAVRAGALAGRGRTVAFTDADLAYSPDQIVDLVEKVEQGWDVVVGSRRHDGTTTLVRAGRLRELGGRAVNWLTFAVLLGRYRDTQCGLKAFRSDAARHLFGLGRIDGFAFDVELFVIAERARLSVAEVPVTITNTTRSSVKVVRHTVRLVRDLLRIRRWAREGRYQSGVGVRPAPIAPERAGTRAVGPKRSRSGSR